MLWRPCTRFSRKVKGRLRQRMLARFPAVTRKLLVTSGLWKSVCKRQMIALAPHNGPIENRDKISRSTLLNLVHQGKFEKVISVWEREKQLNNADPALYTVVMAMCERLKSAELAMAVKEDMERQNWTMELQCGVHYVRALLAESRVEEAMDFIRKTYNPGVKGSGSFLLQCAMALEDSDHMEETLMTCDLYRHSSSNGRHGSLTPTSRSGSLELGSANVELELDCIRIESLGRMQDSQSMLSFVKKRYGNSTQCPHQIQAALTNGLALANKLRLALDRAREGGGREDGGRMVLQPKGLALLLECCVRAKDCKTGVTLYHEFWSKCTELTDSHFSHSHTDRAKYLVRAANAAIRLQAVGHMTNSREHRVRTTRRQEMKQTEFMNKDFYHTILDEGLFPNPDTVEALLLLSCFDGSVRELVERAVRVVVRNGDTPTPRVFTRWGRHCSKVTATSVRKVIQHVRMLAHGYNIPLGLTECEDLLSISHIISTTEQKLEAAKNVRIVGRIMKSNNLLTELSGWNLLLAGYLRTSFMRTVYFTLEDMADCGLKPDLDTFKTLMDGLNAVDKRHAYTMAIYDFWREFTRHFPTVRPDVELLNKLLYSCRKCGQVERALFFLGIIEGCGLNPDLDTFRELLMLCSECGEKEKFEAILVTAHKCLPHQRVGLDAITADCKLKWKAEVDGELASTIIFGSTRSVTGSPGGDEGETEG